MNETPTIFKWKYKMDKMAGGLLLIRLRSIDMLIWNCNTSGSAGHDSCGAVTAAVKGARLLAT